MKPGTPTESGGARQARRRPVAWLALLALLLLGFGSWRGWQALQARRAGEIERASAAVEQWQALDARVDGLRADQRALAQRVHEGDATNRVLRDELLGIDQREALLEDSVRRIADPARHGVQALRMDEAELLLAMGEQRLRLAGDLDGARRAYAIAAGVLAQADDAQAGVLNVRQALVQERAALDALGADPRALAGARLDAFAATLSPPPPRSDHEADADAGPWWRRVLGRIVAVAPANGAVAVAGADRAAGFAALQLELALARTAVERRDEAAFRAALQRADGWLVRLWPDGAERGRRRAQLQDVRGLPLVLSLPTLGSTRAQLQALGAPH